jgi:hypothetical protein
MAPTPPARLRCCAADQVARAVPCRLFARIVYLGSVRLADRSVARPRLVRAIQRLAGRTSPGCGRGSRRRPGARAAIEAAESGATVIAVHRLIGGGDTSFSGGAVYARGGTPAEPVPRAHKTDAPGMGVGEIFYRALEHAAPNAGADIRRQIQRLRHESSPRRATFSVPLPSWGSMSEPE